MFNLVNLSQLRTALVRVKTYITTALSGKQDTLDYGTPTASDVGKALMPKTVVDGEVTKWEFGESGQVDDVQINGTSIVNDKVAEIPIASSSYGVVKVLQSYGITTNNGFLTPVQATDAMVQNPSGSSSLAQFRPITPDLEDKATFYGLALAASDTTQSQSSNPVGTYTDNAKSAIKAMLDIGGETQTVQVTGTTPVITANQNTRYVCGEVTSIDFTPSASGICDVIFTSGSTVAVLTLPNTVKLPAWFDPTALETDTTYEISISDGIYGTVMVW